MLESTSSASIWNFWKSSFFHCSARWGGQRTEKRLIHTGSNRVSTNFWIKHRGDVLGVAVDAFNELEEANRFGHFLGERVRYLGWYTVNFLTDGAVDVIANKVIDMLNGDQSTDFMLSKPDFGVSQKLLGQLDDSTVRPTHVTAGTTLSSQPRDNVNHEIDLIGQHRIKGNERLTRELGQSDIGREVGVCQKASAFVFIECRKQGFSLGFFLKHTLACHFRNIAWLKVYLKWKPVHQTGKFDPGVVQTTDQFVEFFLRRDHDPEFALTNSTEGLNDALKVEHFIHGSGHKMTNFVDNKNKASIFTTPSGQFFAAIGKQIGADIGKFFGTS